MELLMTGDAHSNDRAYPAIFRDVESLRAYEVAQEQARPTKRALAQALAAQLDDSARGGRVGLLPCDTGVLFSELQRVLPRASFVLVDRDQVALARAFARAGSGVGVEVVNSEIEALRLGVPLDVAVVPIALHLMSPERAVESIRHNLAANGRLIVVTKTEAQRSAHPMSAFLDERGARSSFLTSEQLLPLLEAGGLPVERTASVSVAAQIETDQIPIVFSRSANSYLWRQTEEDLAELHAHLRSMAVGGVLRMPLAYTTLLTVRKADA